MGGDDEWILVQSCPAVWHAAHLGHWVKEEGAARKVTADKNYQETRKKSLCFTAFCWPH